MKAGLCQVPLAYEYSNARACVGHPSPPFLCVQTLRHILETRGISSRTSFMRFLASEPTTGFLRLVHDGSRYDGRIAGSPLFVREMQHRSRVGLPPVNLDDVTAWVSCRLGIATDRIMAQSRCHFAVEARALVAWLATCAGSTSLTEVAKHLSCSPSTLHRAICHYLRIRAELFSYETFQEFHPTLTLAGYMGVISRGKTGTYGRERKGPCI